MKDVYLLPFLLPDVFEICKTLTNDEFAEVLPRVQPLFEIKDSAQTMLMLIESIPMFAQKTSPEVFRKSELPGTASERIRRPTIDDVRLP
jgi:SCY1-like protein 2